MTKPPIELTIFAKVDGPLTKRISLLPDGSLKSDGSACLMALGSARRAGISNLAEFGSLISALKTNEAIALGQLRPDLPDEVAVVTKRRLNGGTGVIARTGDNIVFCQAEHALVLLDFDQKGMPGEVAAKVRQHGGFWGALVTVLPELTGAGRLLRASTSAGLYHAETGAELEGSEGMHAYVVARDGTDSNRFLRALHDRCWLAGLGWYMLGAAGQLLDRSIVDRMVGGPERLVFEGGPLLDPPVRQHCERRKPVATAGEALDTVAACPPLTIAENSRLGEIKAKAAHALVGERVRAKRAFIGRQAKALVERTGVSEAEATRTVERQVEGVLRPDVVLSFDDEEFAGCTVGDVLADPDRFEGATLADPLEGVDYGRCVAKVMRRENGSVWIHSFAHGRTIYDLKLDGAAARRRLEQAELADIGRVLVALVMDLADLDVGEVETLRSLAAQKSGIGVRAFNAWFKAERSARAAQRIQERRERQLAARKDPRTRLDAPADDEPWLPAVVTLNEMLWNARCGKPTVRNIRGASARARRIALPKTHKLTQTQANPMEDDA